MAENHKLQLTMFPYFSKPIYIIIACLCKWLS